MLISKSKKIARIRRGFKTRKHLNKLNAVRLVVYRTSRHMYAQVITKNPVSIISAASTLEKNILQKQQYTGNKQSAAIIGRVIAERTLQKGFSKVSFDRSGFKYHGRIKALAEASRKVGLIF